MRPKTPHRHHTHTRARTWTGPITLCCNGIRRMRRYRVINEIVREARRSVQEDPSLSKPLLQRSGSAVASDMDRGDPSFDHGVCRAYYRLTDIKMQLTPYVEDVVRSEVPRRTLDQAYESKEAVADAVKTALQSEMKRYGFSSSRSRTTSAFTIS